MNLLMICFTIWRWGTSLTEMMTVKPANISNSTVLRTIKTHTMTACWLECQKTTGCETIGTDSDNEKINDLAFDCYILGSGENKREFSNETPLKDTELNKFSVIYIELVYSITCSCLVYMFPLRFSGSKFFEATCYSFPRIS